MNLYKLLCVISVYDKIVIGNKEFYDFAHAIKECSEFWLNQRVVLVSAIDKDKIEILLEHY